MGADNHSTTRVETDNSKLRARRLINDLQDCEGISGARHDMVTPSGVVFETDAHGIPQEAVRILAEHDARLSPEHDPFEAFV